MSVVISFMGANPNQPMGDTSLAGPALLGYTKPSLHIAGMRILKDNTTITIGKLFCTRSWLRPSCGKV